MIIHGESGTGKELVAHAIHALGRRSEGPFITCNCAASTRPCWKVSFSAMSRAPLPEPTPIARGVFEAAHRGDIFLDEVGDIPPPIQVKLLRVLESKQFERVGDVPFRLMSASCDATHRNLELPVRQVSGRPVFPHQCHSHKPAASAGTSGRSPPAGGSFPQPVADPQRQGISAPGSHADFPGSPWPGHAPELIGALEYALRWPKAASSRLRTCLSWVALFRELRQRPRLS